MTRYACVSSCFLTSHVPFSLVLNSPTKGSRCHSDVGLCVSPYQHHQVKVPSLWCEELARTQVCAPAELKGLERVTDLQPSLRASSWGVFGSGYSKYTVCHDYCQDSFTTFTALSSHCSTEKNNFQLPCNAVIQN